MIFSSTHNKPSLLTSNSSSDLKSKLSSIHLKKKKKKLLIWFPHFQNMYKPVDIFDRGGEFLQLVVEKKVWFACFKCKRFISINSFIFTFDTLQIKRIPFLIGITIFQWRVIWILKAKTVRSYFFFPSVVSPWFSPPNYRASAAVKTDQLLWDVLTHLVGQEIANAGWQRRNGKLTPFIQVSKLPNQWKHFQEQKVHFNT